MAWYKTGRLSIAANSKKATGHGTRWADNKQGIGPGQMLLLPGMGSVVLYEIASVVSDTELILVSGPPKAVKEASYAIVTYNGGSYVDFGRELSAQLRYYQRQMDGWQQIMTGEGEVTLEAPDGTQVTLSSFKKLTADVAGKVDKSELDKKANKSDLDGKADKAELDAKADKAVLDGKADKSDLDGKLDKTGGTVTGELTCNSSIRGRSFGCKAGVNGTHAGHQFNFNWTDASQLEAWVDVTRVGGVTLYAINSDKGLKKDIRYRNDIDEAYREVKNWKVATYRYKERGIIPESGELLGFIANDLIEHSPECVHGKGLPEDYDVTADPNNPDAYYLDHTAMIAKLTQALHVTMEKVERLERGAKVQQAEIDALKASMSTVSVAQDADCWFRSHPITDSDFTRSLIPVTSDH